MSLVTERSFTNNPYGMALFDHGANSTCFTDGKKVVKIIPGGKTGAIATAKLNLLNGEYNLLKNHLGRYALDSSFSIDDQNGWEIRIEQEFVRGTPLRHSLGIPNPAVVDFLRKSLGMYEKTGITPDLYPDIMFDPSLGIFLVGRYVYRTNPNVFLTPEEPVLVDTTLSRPIRNGFTRPLASGLVAKKIQLILSGLEG